MLTTNVAVITKTNVAQHHESAGKHKSGRRRHGNRWLGAALGTAATAASRTRDTTYLGARYLRLMPRLGKKKALVALEHSNLTAVWYMLTQDTPFHDLGGNCYAKHDPERALRRYHPPGQRPGHDRPLRTHRGRLNPPTGLMLRRYFRTRPAVAEQAPDGTHVRPRHHTLTDCHSGRLPGVDRTVQVSPPARRAARSPLPCCSTAVSSCSAISVS
jgi:hypothetical protein